MARGQSQQGPAGMSFFALPDDRRVPVRLGPTGAAEFGRRNVLSFPDTLAEFLAREAPEYWYPQPDGTDPGAPAWILNQCADPDTYAEIHRHVESGMPLERAVALVAGVEGAA